MLQEFNKYINSFTDIDVGFIYYKFKKVSSFCIYDQQNYDSLKYLIDNIHIYLTYTIPEYRSKGYGSILIKFLKYWTMKNNIKTITVCTDISENNRVPNMLINNNFKYFKTGYYKIIKK